VVIEGLQYARRNVKHLFYGILEKLNAVIHAVRRRRKNHIGNEREKKREKKWRLSLVYPNA